ncbi:hypothetical protein I6F65_17545 [Pseudoalteromonas sp. SWXJZ94C]|uniref:hypothetical protein n=1 Tax=Pseudoalteromonas sp. SWXJZ94C TaxID=2792065 RepID=UPI0018CD76D4|nr:hypothetical protein [Pseudoalteromonas sp. SWXJZ94C]MBH0058750.1 hypothetical protein [Pseudoalteromonas sp. SWXJZ94C]
MEVNCNQCKRKIDAENINVSKDTAYCLSCESLISLSSLLETSASKKFDTTQSIDGVKVDEHGGNWSINASNRGLIALFLVPFTFVWVGSSLSGIYGTQLANGEFDLQKSLFGLPFLIGSVVLISFTLMSVFGRTNVSCENGKTLVFIGIGSIGWYRRFEWKNIERITESYSRQKKHLSLEGSKRVNLGWGLSSEKLYYMSNYLKTKLKK